MGKPVAHIGQKGFHMAAPHESVLTSQGTGSKPPEARERRWFPLPARADDNRATPRGPQDSDKPRKPPSRKDGAATEYPWLRVTGTVERLAERT